MIRRLIRDDDPHARLGGVSRRAFALMCVIALAIVLPERATDGRSWGLLAVAGLVTVVDCGLYLRRSDVRSPRRSDDIFRPLGAIGGIVVGIAFVVLGILAAAGTLDLGR